MSLKNHFLIALPSQAGAYFGNTITYLCEHSDEGAMGLMVNRPMTLSVARLMQQTGISGTENLKNTPVLQGGPVSPEQGFVMHSDDGDFTASRDLGAGLRLSTAREVLEAIARGRGPYHYLIALGYAGWGPNQLERELADNAWLCCRASNEILFDVPFEDRIDAAARTLGIDFRLISGQMGEA